MFAVSKLKGGVKLIINGKLTKEEILQRKLEILSDEERYGYGLRFMNIGEFDEIIEQNCFGRSGRTKEIFVALDKRFSLPKIFEDIMRIDRITTYGLGPQFPPLVPCWSGISSYYTGWDHCRDNLDLVYEFFKCLREARKGNEGKTNKEKFCRVFRGEFIKIIIWKIRYGGMVAYDAEATGKINYYSSRSDHEERMSIIREFMSQDDWFARQGNTLRKLLNAVMHWETRTGNSECRPYHLMMLVYPTHFSSKELPLTWQHMDTEQELENNTLLGVVIMIPDKQMMNKVIETSKSAEYPFVIYDYLGCLRYPKK